MGQMGLAMQLYSVREDLERDFAGTLNQLGKMGYEGVEFAGLYGHEPGEVKAMLDDAGLQAVSAHLTLSQFGDNPEEVMEAYGAMGCPYLAVAMLMEEERPGREGWKKAAETMKKLAALAEEKGMQLLYHNHAYEFNPRGDHLVCDEIYALSDKLWPEPDTCWISVSGIDPVGFLHGFPGRVPLVHLKDFELFGPLPVHLAQRLGRPGTGEHRLELRPVGMGMQDLPALLSACRSAGTRWIVVEEDNPDSGRSAMECARLSAACVQELL